MNEQELNALIEQRVAAEIEKRENAARLEQRVTEDKQRKDAALMRVAQSARAEGRQIREEYGATLIPRGTLESAARDIYPVELGSNG